MKNTCRYLIHWEKGTLSLHIDTQNHCLCVRLTQYNTFTRSFANSKMPSYHVCILPKYVLPDILHYKNSGKRIKLRIKVKRENNNGLCCCTGGAACQVGFAERHIPKPVIINGLTSTGKKKKRTESENSGQKKSLQTK